MIKRQKILRKIRSIHNSMKVDKTTSKISLFFPKIFSQNTSDSTILNHAKKIIARKEELGRCNHVSKRETSMSLLFFNMTLKKKLRR